MYITLLFYTKYMYILYHILYTLDAQIAQGCIFSVLFYINAYHGLQHQLRNPQSDLHTPAEEKKTRSSRAHRRHMATEYHSVLNRSKGTLQSDWLCYTSQVCACHPCHEKLTPVAFRSVPPGLMEDSLCTS